MAKISKNLELYKAEDTIAFEYPFALACRDRESRDERWVLVHLSEQEAKRLYNYLGQYFE